MKSILQKERLGVNDVHEPVEKVESNDKTNAENEKDCYEFDNFLYSFGVLFLRQDIS